jgi:DNA polymerase III delta prime subunit
MAIQDHRTSSTPQLNPADQERELVERFIRSVGRAGVSSDRTEIVNFYVALKSKPLAILAGPAGSGKMALVRCLAQTLLGDYCLQCQLMAGHPWWAEKCENIAAFAGVQTYFTTEKLFCLIEEAWQPENTGRLFLGCLARISPAEILEYFCAVAFQLRHGQLMRLGNAHLKEPVPWPTNLQLIGTMDTDRYDWWDDDLFPYTTVILWNQAGGEAAIYPTLEAAYSNGESEFLRSSLRGEPAVHRKLHTFLGWRNGRLRQPIRPLLEIEAVLENIGIQLPHGAIQEALVYLANAWTRQGAGLFDPCPVDNLAIALDFAITQAILPRAAERIGSSQARYDGLRNALNGQFPHATGFLESLRGSLRN